jgi:integrase
MYGTPACQPVRPESEMPKPTTKITEATRQAALKQPLRPSIIKDSEIAGLALIVTTRRAFWAQNLQPRGLRPDGKRWTLTRHELGDARTMTVAKARAASQAAKLAIHEGRDPHRERLASRASSIARRSIVPTTAGDAADLYAQALEARAHLSDATKSNARRYVAKAIRLLGGGSVALAAIDTPAVRLMLDAVNSSAVERHHVFSTLNRFLTWCAKRGLIPVNPCAGIDRDDRPRPGRSRDHTPTIATIRRVWDAIEGAPAHVRDLIRFLLLVPLRREEAQGLLWSEANLDETRIDIRAERMKNRQPHSLPLSEQALAVLAGRPSCRGANDRVFAPPSGASTINWGYWVARIRVALGEGDLERSRRFNLHDVRRSFVSQLTECDHDVDLLDQLLSHTRRGVFGTYQRSSRWREKAAAMAAWAELVAPSVARDNVVAIRAR